MGGKGVFSGGKICCFKGVGISIGLLGVGCGGVVKIFRYIFFFGRKVFSDFVFGEVFFFLLYWFRGYFFFVISFDVFRFWRVVL